MGVLVGYYITAYYFKMVESTYVGVLVGYYITAYYFKMVESTCGDPCRLLHHSILF